MRLTALTIGAGVPSGDFAGRIREVHARAALLAIADGRLATLVAPELGSEPRGITFAAPADFSLRSVVAVDAELAVRQGVLRVAGTLALDMRGAKPWRCGLTALQLNLRSAAVGRAYRTARSALNADGRSGPLRNAAGTILNMLDNATGARNAAAAEQAVSSLVGLGEGRTPAADDYLVGYFAALWAGSEASKSFAAALASPVLALAARTEDLSRHYLEAAATGEVSERIAAVAAGIAAGAGDSLVLEAVAGALSVGHSSGAAALEGLLQGCAACAEMPPQACAEAGSTATLPARSSLSATLRQMAASSR